MSLTKQYFKYVSQNIFGLLGTSCYILADTYFISQAAGTSGVALLNLCLPIYNFIFAIGSMLGLGAATRYAILRAQGDERSERYFSNALLWAMVFALPSCWWASSAPRCCCGSWAATRRSLPWAWGTPASSCCSRPSSCATTSSRPLSGTTATPRWPWWRPSAEALQRGVRLHLHVPHGPRPARRGVGDGGLAGVEHCALQPPLLQKEQHRPPCAAAALAEAAGPELPAGRLGLRGRDVLRRDHHRLQPAAPASGGQCGRGGLRRRGELRAGGDGCLQRRGPGAQPLVSRCYGKNDAAGARKLLLLGSGTALALAAALYAVLFGFTGPVVAVFNSENSALMAQYAFSGTRIYFLGYFFAGLNIVAAGYLAQWTAPQRLLRRRFPAASWPSWPALWC